MRWFVFALDMRSRYHTMTIDADITFKWSFASAVVSCIVCLYEGRILEERFFVDFVKRLQI